MAENPNKKQKWKLGRLMQETGVRELCIFAKRAKPKLSHNNSLKHKQIQKDLFHMFYQGKSQKELIKRKIPLRNKRLMISK